MRKSKFFLASAAALIAIALLLNGAAADTGLTPIEQLGKDIFFDQNLSINLNQSCAACHGPEVGWTGPNEATNMHGGVYEGSIPGAFGDRKPPSSSYATFSPVFHMDRAGDFVGGNFWDGRATGWSLGNPSAEQALGPFLNPKEQALPSAADVVSRVCAASYGDLFRQIWGAAACDPLNTTSAYNSIGYSVAAFEASPEVNSFTSKYDYARLNMAKLTKEERKGFALFQGKADCKACHPSAGSNALFTDFTYDNLGIPKNPENPATIADPSFVDPGLGGFLSHVPEYAAYADAQMGKHKVPTLRNVDLRPSPGFVKDYGHNGYFKSLYGIVHYYNTRDVLPTCPGLYTEAQALAANCWPAPEVTANLNTAEIGDLGLTYEEELDLVAFLTTLSDGYIP
jgi:cytochrome c peroxidase